MRDGSGRQSSATFGFTGSAQTWVVPAGVTSVTVDVRGADGAPELRDTGGSDYGHAAEVTSTLGVFPGETLQLMVGGRTAYGGRGGWNGGGTAGNDDYPYGGGGGGASDVRRFGVRVIVAGGGGGGGSISSSARYAGTPGKGGDAGIAIPVGGGVAPGSGGANSSGACGRRRRGWRRVRLPGLRRRTFGRRARRCARVTWVFAAGGNGGSSAAGGNGGFLHRASGMPCAVAKGTGGGGGGGWAGGGGGGGGVTSGGGGGGGSSFGPAGSSRVPATGDWPGNGRITVT